MSTPETPPQGQAATLAAALIARMGPLAQAAAHAKDGIAADREGFAGAGEADALIDTVVARVDDLEADCRRLMTILSGFEAAATSEPEPAAEPEPEAASPAIAAAAPLVAEEATPAEPEPEAAEQPEAATEPEPEAHQEPTPAEEAAGITTFPGSASAEPEPEPETATDEPPSGDPISAEPPPSGEPVVAEPPPTGAPIAAEPPPSGAPADVSPPVEPEVAAEGDGTEGAETTAEPAPAEEPAADPSEPVHVSEGVRLLATQMSVAGASTDDIARRLHNDFGVEDADRLIAHLFGPGSQTPR